MTLVNKQLLPPATKFGQGYVFIRFFPHSQGGLPHCMLGYTPPWNQRQAPPHPPWDQRQAPPLGVDTPRSRHPHPHPGTRHIPRSRHIPPGAVHAGRYGQKADGTHPTGMQSCFKWNIQPMAKYPRIIYTAIGGNNMSKFIHYQKLANMLILKLK